MAAVLLGGTVAAGSPATASCDDPNSPPADVGSQDNTISGLAHLTPCNVWEVGNWSNGAGPNNDQQYITHGLVEHWNGSGWRLMDLPTVGSADDNVILLGVNGVAPYDLWAVGRRNDNANDFTVAFHWNGHTWSHVPTPNPRQESELVDVAAHTHTDAWAVGSTSDTRGHLGLIERWNGRRWSVQSRIVNADLTAVTVTRGGRAWTVGDVTRQGKHYGLILHWTGSSWISQAQAMLPAGSGLLAVAARGSDNVWAVGQSSGGSKNFALHFTNGRWSRVRVPQQPADTNAMVAVTPAADGAVWAVTTYEINGAAWSHVLVRRNESWRDLGCSPTNPNHLSSVAAAQPGTALVAGFSENGTGSHFVTRQCP